MTRKHYNAIASALAARRDEIPAETFETLAHEIADFCKEENPEFSRDRFFKACMQ